MEYSNANFRPNQGSCEKCNYSRSPSIAGIEPAALRFRCSSLTNWTTESSCRALATHACMYNGVMSVEGIWVNAILCTFYVYKFAFEYSIHKKNDLLLALSNEISQNLAISHIYRLYHVIFDDQIKTRLIKVLAFVSTVGVQSQLLEYNFCLRHMWENYSQFHDMFSL